MGLKVFMSIHLRLVLTTVHLGLMPLQICKSGICGTLWNRIPSKSLKVLIIRDTLKTTTTNVQNIDSTIPPDRNIIFNIPDSVVMMIGGYGGFLPVLTQIR